MNFFKKITVILFVLSFGAAIADNHNKKEELSLRRKLKTRANLNKFKRETKGMSITKRITWLKKFLNG